jgi:hypothetical protein
MKNSPRSRNSYPRTLKCMVMTLIPTRTGYCRAFSRKSQAQNGINEAEAYATNLYGPSLVQETANDLLTILKAKQVSHLRKHWALKTNEEKRVELCQKTAPNSVAQFKYRDCD